MKKILMCGMVLLAIACKKEAVAVFETEKSAYYLEQQVSFSNKSKNASSYSWDFGDGSSATEVNPSHVYLRPRDYQVKLTLNNGNTFTKVIQIYPGTASYAIKNNTPVTFRNVFSLYGQDNEIIDYFMHTSGPFNTGQVTNTIYTYRPITQSGIEDDYSRYITESYSLIKGEHNVLEITGKTRVYIQTKSSLKPDRIKIDNSQVLSQKLKID